MTEGIQWRCIFGEQYGSGLNSLCNWWLYYQLCRCLFYQFSDLCIMWFSSEKINHQYTCLVCLWPRELKKKSLLGQNLDGISSRLHIMNSTVLEGQHIVRNRGTNRDMIAMLYRKVLKERQTTQVQINDFQLYLEKPAASV